MNKVVFIAGAIGLFFGFLFSATLGVQLFPDDEQNEIVNDGTGTLRKDAETFKTAYNITESIYQPITAAEAYDMIDNDETFILYAGRETCPYCQSFVPVLMEAAENNNITVIYYIDTTDPLNEDFVSGESVNSTPTTFIYNQGNLEDKMIGYNNLSNTEQFILDNY